MYTTYISTEALAAQIHDPDWLIIDVRFDLMNPPLARQMYAAAHLPNAHFLDLNDDLAGPLTGRNGRHPLPDQRTFLNKLRALGLNARSQVVVYDQGSTLYVGRTWWMIQHWLGHRACAVLDGGYAAWEKELRTLSSEKPAAQKGPFSGEDLPKNGLFAPQVNASALLSGLAQGAHAIVDARASERFRGELEPIDASPGHIPGALNRPFSKNIGADGKALSPAQLKAEFETLLAGRRPSDVVHSCGSGVSACANLLAMEHAGLTGSKLYIGSWSEWSSDPSRPIAKGCLTGNKI